MPATNASHTPKVTPPELAKRWRCAPEKVLDFIRTNELRAINIARPHSKRPQYLIDETDIADFERRRTAGTAPAAPSRPLRRKAASAPRNYFGD